MTAPLALLEEPNKLSTADWLEANVVMPEGTETAGQMFSLADFPHVKGVCEALDRAEVRRIILQWGTRLGKTTTCVSVSTKIAGTRPRNMMIVSTTKDSVGRVVDSRLYPMLRRCDATRGMLPALGRQGKFHVDLKACRIYVGWSGSDSSLADVGAWYVHCNEIDKWEADKSDEADPLELAINRAKGFVDHKIMLESTPTIKNRSRIERALLASKRHDRYVPCPHCGEYQILRKGDGKAPGGIKWDRSATGKSDPEVAFQTAYYECPHCLGRIEDYHRVPMLRKGVWCPEGCTVDRSGAVVGRAYREGSDRWGFGPLPSWYSLIERWGNFARMWVTAQGNKRQLQDVFNSYMAETFEEIRRKEKWEDLAERLITKSITYRVAPEWASVVTVGIDRQKDGRLPWVFDAWGPEQRCATIGYGEAETFDELFNVLTAGVTHADQRPIALGFGLMDYGFEGKGVNEFCIRCRAAGLNIWPSKGSSTLMSSDYSISILGPNTASPGMRLFLVDTNRTQSWLEGQLNAGDESYAIHAGAKEDHQDFLEQLLNDAAVDKLDSSNNLRRSWDRIDENVPNDFRDARRYAYIAMLKATRGGRVPKRAAVGQRPSAPEGTGKRPTSAVDVLLRQRKGAWV